MFVLGRSSLPTARILLRRKSALFAAVYLIRNDHNDFEEWAGCDILAEQLTGGKGGADF